MQQRAQKCLAVGALCARGSLGRASRRQKAKEARRGRGRRAGTWLLIGFALASRRDCLRLWLLASLAAFYWRGAEQLGLASAPKRLGAPPRQSHKISIRPPLPVPRWPLDATRRPARRAAAAAEPWDELGGRPRHRGNLPLGHKTLSTIEFGSPTFRPTWAPLWPLADCV